MSAVARARPGLSAGSLRAPASKSICTSTIGMDGLSTKYTFAPLDCVQCWMGSAAFALRPIDKSAADPSAARSNPRLKFIGRLSLSAEICRRSRTGLAVGIDRLRTQDDGRDV